MVVAIIAILVSILMPSLRRARELAKTASCSIQMRNIMLAMTMYTEDNDHRWPGFVFEHVSDCPGSDHPATPHWHQQWSPFFGTSSPSSGDCPGLLSGKWLDPEQLFCPDGFAKKIGKWGSYSANVYILYNDNLGPPYGRRVFKTSIPQPSATLLFVEEEENCLDNEHFAVRTGLWVNMIASRHGRGANMSFVDLHVEYWKWTWPSTGVYTIQNAPDPGNPDLDRINRAQEPPHVP